MQIVPISKTIPDSLITGLAERDVSIWVGGNTADSIEPDVLVDMLRLPWKQVFVEGHNPDLIAVLDIPDTGLLVRRRGFIHVVDTDPSRISLPQRALPVFLLAGRNDSGSQFEQQLRRMTMLEALRRSGVRQLVVVGDAGATVPTTLDEIWATGFRSRVVTVDERPSSVQRITDWLASHDQGSIVSIVTLSEGDFAKQLIAAFSSAYEDGNLLVRQRDVTGAIHQIDLTDIDDSERPLLESYDLILDRDCTSIDADELPKAAFDAFFRGEFCDWRAYSAGLPWVRSDIAWHLLQAQLRRLDSAGSSENRITFIQSEAGAGGTTLARYLAFRAAREGYPTLVAKDVPFTPDALTLINFLTRSKQKNENFESEETAGTRTGSNVRLYETPWLLVFDRVHWEFRDAELRRFLQQLVQAGRAACILVVTGPIRETAYFDESRFKQLAELNHLLEPKETLALGKHLNRFLRHYGNERPDWQWRNFQEAHSVRYLEGLAAFWVTLAFWLQTQYDLNDSIQEWVYRAFKEGADTLEVRKAVLQIAALSAERLPLPESLIDQGTSPWPVPLLLDDRRSLLSPLGLVCISHGGRKYWAMAHDILGRLLTNAIFYHHDVRSSLGFADARDALHLRFLILREVACKTTLGELAERNYGEEFATTVFKIDPDHGRASWNHLWREVLAALDGMPTALRNGSRVFRHHTAISRRRIAWLDEVAYGVSGTDRVDLLTRAIDDVTYALHSIDGMPGDESDVNLYNSLANAYFDLARVRAGQSAPPDELAKLRRLASDATRHAYEQNPSNPYVVETHVKNLIASAEETKDMAPGYCVEALEAVYAAIRDDSNTFRRHALAVLADRAMLVLMSAGAESLSRGEPTRPAEVLVSAWVALSSALGGRAPESLTEVPADVLRQVIRELDHPAGVGNVQVARLKYQVAVAADPLDFASQLQTLDLLVAADYRLAPQLRLEYALLLFQQMRAEEGNREFKALRILWRESDIFVQVPDRLRWLLQHDSKQPRVVTANIVNDHGSRTMARVPEFGRFDIPFRPQEFGVHRQETSFKALVSFGHNGPFLRPTNARR